MPPHQKGSLAKDGFSEPGKCIGKLQPCEWCCVVACVFSRDARLCVSAWGRLGVTNAQAHLIDRWDVTVWLAKARLSTRLPCEMSKRMAYLRGQFIAREKTVAVRLAARGITLHSMHEVGCWSCCINVTFYKVVLMIMRAIFALKKVCCMKYDCQTLMGSVKAQCNPLTIFSLGGSMPYNITRELRIINLQLTLWGNIYHCQDNFSFDVKTRWGR